MIAPSELPFAWALKPGQLSAPSGPLAELLAHEHAALLSQALHGGFRLIYGAPERHAKGRVFLGECRRDDRAAMDRLHELLVFAMLSLERWLFLEVEPALEGASRPEFLMAAHPNYQLHLVEVKTVHRVTALVPSDGERRRFEAQLRARVAAMGYGCREVVLHALPNQIPGPDQEDKVVGLILAHLRRSLLRPRGAYSVDLPGGAKVDVLLSDPGFRGPLADRLREIDDARFSVTKTFNETIGGFRQHEALAASYARKIPTRIGRAAAQTEASHGGLPSVVAISLSDPDWTVRSAFAAIRDELLQRQATARGPVAVLLASFFEPKPEPIAEAPDWVKAAEVGRWRETLVLGAHAAWVRLSDAAPRMSNIPTFDPEAPKSVVKVPTLPSRPDSAGAMRHGRPRRRRR